MLGFRQSSLIFNTKHKFIIIVWIWALSFRFGLAVDDDYMPHWRKRCRGDCWLKMSRGRGHCALVGVGIYFLTELMTFILAICALSTYIHDPVSCCIPE
jgi:hypothetical protein